MKNPGRPMSNAPLETDLPGAECQARYEKRKPRLGHKRAIVAVAHALVPAIYKLLSTGEPYPKPGAHPLSEAQAAKLIRHHTRRLKTLRRFATVRQPAQPAGQNFSEQPG